MTGWEIKAIQLGVGAGIPTLRGDNPAVKALGIGAKFMGPVIIQSGDGSGAGPPKKTYERPL